MHSGQVPALLHASIIARMTHCGSASDAGGATPAGHAANNALLAASIASPIVCHQQVTEEVSIIDAAFQCGRCNG